VIRLIWHQVPTSTSCSTAFLKEINMEAKGSLRKNPRKEKESHPDLTGKWTDATGQQYWLSAWRNVDQKTGDVYFSLKLGNPVEERGDAPMKPVPAHSAAKANAYQPMPDDDIPF
jgi:hypothetical protein